MYNSTTFSNIKELDEKKVNLLIECVDLEATIATKQTELDELKKLFNLKQNAIRNVKIELNLKQIFKKSLKSNN